MHCDDEFAYLRYSVQFTRVIAVEVYVMEIDSGPPWVGTWADPD